MALQTSLLNSEEEYDCVVCRKRSGAGDHSEQLKAEPDKCVFSQMDVLWPVYFTPRNKAEKKELWRELRAHTTKPYDLSWTPETHIVEVVL